MPELIKLPDIVEVPTPWGTQYLMNDTFMCHVGYEDGMFDLVRSQEWPDTVVFLDLGAHQGYWTSFLAKLRPQAFVWAFEPSLHHCCYLLNNLMTQRIANVAVVPCAVSDEDGEAELYPCHPRHEACFWSSFTITKERPIQDRVATVTTKRLDSFVFPRIDFIKMDIEGGAAAAIRGGEKTLRTHRPRILIEVHETCKVSIPEHGKRLNELLQPLGYTCEMQDTGGRNVLWCLPGEDIR